jgi:hypothetical protein
MSELLVYTAGTQLPRLTRVRRIQSYTRFRETLETVDRRREQLRLFQVELQALAGPALDL